MSKTPNSDEQTFGIGAVAKMTGISDHTIRVWERRYQAVVAQRTASSRRVYTAADVERLSLLKLLTDKGLSIGQIATESQEALRRRVDSMTELAVTRSPSQINVAILGDFLPAKIQSYTGDLAPVNCIILDTSAERFAADIRLQSVDVLVLESAVLDNDTAKQLRRLMQVAGARKGILVYGFGTSQDVERLRDSGIVPLRGSVSIDELIAAIVGTYAKPRAAKVSKSAANAPISDQDWVIDGVVEPRRFTQEQLSSLANIASSIDCECPQNLAELVADLSAFEIYSANCANRNADDAALHLYLHQTTSKARALMERALERVAKMEKLSY